MAPWSGRAVALLLLTAGMFLVWRGWRGDRSRGRPRCPRCWYDLTGAPTATCPECGHTLRDPADRFRTRRHFRLVLVGLLVATALPSYVVQRRVRAFGWGYYLTYGPLYYLFPTTVIRSVRVGDYTVRVEADRRSFEDGPQRVRVKRGWRTCFAAQGEFRWSVGYDNTYSERRGLAVPPGTDVNGNGIPDVVLVDWSGGAHCCYTILILELAPDGVRQLARISTEHGHADFVDFEGDGRLELLVPDWTFAYWKTSFAGSPAPTVVLSWQGGRYAPAPGLMRAPLPSAGELRAKAVRVRDAILEEGNPTALGGNSEIWATMLDLIYTGHADAAYEFFEVAWPARVPGKREFLRDFREQLASSPYRETIEALGHPPLPERRSRLTAE